MLLFVFWTSVLVLVNAESCWAQATTRFAKPIVSPNFRVFAPTQQIAQQVADTAEVWRKKLAVTWFGHRLPCWNHRCDIRVTLGKSLGAGGATKFKFDRGQVYDWDMRVQGSLERVLDSVIPHEVNHTILACYFRRPVPRWADEGAATLVEHESEQLRQLRHVKHLVQRGRRIPLRILFGIKEYPNDSDQVMALYAEGFSLTEYLVQKGGHKQFLLFLNDAHHRGWDAAVKAYYKLPNIETLERAWMGWVIAGQPKLNLPAGQLLAKQKSGAGRVAGVIRSQNPVSKNELASLAKTTGNSNGRSSNTVASSNNRSGRADPSWTGSIRFEPVAAPAPRKSFAMNGQQMASTPVTRSNSKSSTVPPAVRFIANETPRRTRPDVIQPLAMVRIADARAATGFGRSRLGQSGNTNRDLETRFDLAPPVVSEEAAFGPRLRETRLRTKSKPSSGRFLDWAQFPKAD